MKEKGFFNFSTAEGKSMVFYELKGDIETIAMTSSDGNIELNGGIDRGWIRGWIGGWITGYLG